MESKFTKLGFVRTFVVPALLLFAIPGLGFWFGGHVLGRWDAMFLEGVHEGVSKDAELSAEKRGGIIAFYTENSASSLCAAGASDALPPGYFDEVCGDFTQVRLIKQASFASIALGILSLVFMLGCAAASFASRQAQYLSFLVGWNFLRVASFVQVLLQGAITIGLSFWLTAYFFEVYYIKLIGVLGILALMAAFVVIKSIFTKPDDRFEVEGELLARDKSPALWSRIDAMCGRLGTAPPDRIIGGIDDNFFVTEHPIQLKELKPSGSFPLTELRGRSLFVSLSLLKRLNKSEADAVLAHEMAHFSGGDTTHSIKLSPLLSKYGAYLEALYSGGLSLPIFYFMLMYRGLFQLSLGKESRARELRADEIAKSMTSPESVAHALLKVAAYSAYRARVEQGLFERERRHSSLDIAHSIALGFSEYASGERLTSDLDEGRFPHPFDSHPELEARIQAVGLAIPKERYPELVVTSASETWFSEIGDSERIEEALWKAYEARFQAAHEQSLAYRYLPSTPEERAHVEKLFPPRELMDDHGQQALYVDFEKMSFVEWKESVPFERIQELKVDDGITGKVLQVIALKEGGGKKTFKIPLKAIASVPHEEVLNVVGHYYGRHQTAKAHASAGSEKLEVD